MVFGLLFLKLTSLLGLLLSGLTLVLGLLLGSLGGLLGLLALVLGSSLGLLLVSFGFLGGSLGLLGSALLFVLGILVILHVRPVRIIALLALGFGTLFRLITTILLVLLLFLVLLVLALLLLQTLALLLVQGQLLVLLALLLHRLLSSVGHLLKQLVLLLLGKSSFLSSRLEVHLTLSIHEIIFSFVLSCNSGLDDFLSLTLKTLSHIDERLVTTPVLDVKDLSLDLFLNLGATELRLNDSLRHIRDDQSNNDLQGDDEMLNQDSYKDNIGTVPEGGVALVKPLHQDRFFFFQEGVEILARTNLLRWESADEEDDDVHRDSEVGDEAHDGHPVSNTASSLSSVSSSVLLEVLHLDVDLEQVSQEREEGSEGESRSEERNETKLNDSFVVVVDESGGCRSHLELFLDLHVHHKVSLGD